MMKQEPTRITEEFSLPRVAVVILSYNGGEDVLRALRSVFASDYLNLLVILVDNASLDGTPQRVRQEFPDCIVLVNTHNQGFGAGCNVGIRFALTEKADFIFLLNQDAVIASDTLSQLVTAAQQHPRAAVFGPKTLTIQQSLDGHQRLLYTGAWRRRLPLQQIIPDIEKPDTGIHNTARPVDYIWGHGMLLRAVALYEIGLFDPAYFFYYEDIDLCRRAANAGWGLWYIPAAIMWHDVDDGARASSSELWRWQLKVTSINIFYHKFYSRWLASILTWLTLLQMCFDFLRWRRFNAAWHLLRAWMEGGVRSIYDYSIFMRIKLRARVTINNLRIMLRLRNPIRRVWFAIVQKVHFLLPSQMRQLLFAGKTRHCPICNSYVRIFPRFGYDYHYWCPVCRSLQRHRYVWRFFQRATDLFDGKPKKMLHFAPEPMFLPRLRAVLNLHYVTCDLYAPNVDVHTDIVCLPWNDQIFDVIYCSHVLEHIPDDYAAMRELHRVLHPNGWAIVMVPVIAASTFEDTTITDPMEREQLFGQHDHVRAYGSDIRTRLEEVGFRVTVIYAGEFLDAQERKKMEVPENEAIFLCRH